MKKILIVLICLLCISGCQEVGKENIDPNERYYVLIDYIREHEGFLSYSNYYDISAEMAKIEDGYRYYVTIDNPKSAIYDVEAVAIEENRDYTNTMAANVGIFEDKIYSLIPNQKNSEKGYVNGLVMSGVTENSETTLYIYVSFKNEDHSITKTEYFKIDVAFED